LLWSSHSFYFFFSSRRRHTRFSRDWSSDVCSSDLIALVAEGLLVGGETAGEGEKLRILLVGAGVHRGGEGIALTAHLLRLFVGIGLDDHLLTIGVGADLFRLLEAPGTQLPGLLLPLRSHPPVH